MEFFTEVYLMTYNLSLPDKGVYIKIIGLA